MAKKRGVKNALNFITDLDKLFELVKKGLPADFEWQDDEGGIETWAGFGSGLITANGKTMYVFACDRETGMCHGSCSDDFSFFSWDKHRGVSRWRLCELRAEKAFSDPASLKKEGVFGGPLVSLTYYYQAGRKDLPPYMSFGFEQDGKYVEAADLWGEPYGSGDKPFGAPDDTPVAIVFA